MCLCAQAPVCVGVRARGQSSASFFFSTCFIFNTTKLSTWCSEDSLQESSLSFHHVGPQGQTPIMALSTESLYELSHLTTGPLYFLYEGLAEPGVC